MSHFKKELEDKAIKHTAEMQEEFAEEITYSIEHSTVYRNNVDVQPDSPTEKFEFWPITTSAAAMELVCQYGVNVCALNYASYKWPGGGFIKGSSAQEEALCHDSTLYNVIGNKKFENEYASNRTDLHKSLYTNFAIYSTDIVFIDGDDWYKADVLTCPSPNYKAAQEHQVSYFDNLKCLRERAEFMIRVAKANNVKHIVLGAWGCGVFGQNRRDLAVIFKDLLSQYKFETVVFAIPGTGGLTEFKNVFNVK